MARLPDTVAKSILDLAKDAEGQATFKDMERISKLINDVAAPIHDVVKNSDVLKVTNETISNLTGQIEVPNIPNTTMPKIPALDEVVITGGLDVELPDYDFQPPTYDFPPPLREPVKVELPDPVKQPWWQQPWVWGAIGSGLVALDITLRLI